MLTSKLTTCLVEWKQMFTKRKLRPSVDGKLHVKKKSIA